MVIAIIGILVVMLLPAVQSAREAARRVQCMNNFRQVGLALHNYESALGTFPPNMIMWARSQDPACGPRYTTSTYFGLGWGTFILPYLERSAVYDQFDFGGQLGYANDLPNYRVAATRIGTYLCPSDPQNGELCHFTYTGTNGTDIKEDLRQSNMAATADSHEWSCYPWDWPVQFPMVDGVMGAVKGCPIKKIHDGLSKTLLIAEVTGGGPGSYLGHYWATFGFIDTRDGINGPWTIIGGQYAESDSSGIYGMRKTGASSYHPGGCHFLVADGSVHFLTEDLYQAILRSLTTRAGVSNAPGNPIDVSTSPETF